MGSSSAFTVGLLHALHALHGRMVGKQELMTEAIHVEQDLLRETVGSQDQVAAACGGFNKITFAPGGQIQVNPVLLPRGRAEELDAHLMLCYTGFARTAARVAAGWVDGLQRKRRQLRILRDLVDESLELLAGDRPVACFGELLDEAWQLKRSLADGIATGEVDELYAAARAAGAIGGKITGAGGGGFLLLFAPPERQRAVAAALPGLVHVPFRFESQGSQIVFCEREPDYAAADAERRQNPVRAFRELDPAAGHDGWLIPHEPAAAPRAPSPA
jgi:D-glycero-alpha-D-manno-heptose-7-phosphate kinase